MSIKNPKIISWQAPEFRHYQKNYAWYVTFVAVSILVIGFFALNQDYFAAVCLAIMALLLLFFAKQSPEKINIEINSRHIRFGNLMFPYQQIQHFWVVNVPGHKTLNLRTTAMLNNIIILELERQDPEEVRDYLLAYVPEHEETDPTVPQKIMHRLKF
jgi:hypothetical protein